MHFEHKQKLAVRVVPSFDKTGKLDDESDVIKDQFELDLLALQQAAAA